VKASRAFRQREGDRGQLCAGGTHELTQNHLSVEWWVGKRDTGKDVRRVRGGVLERGTRAESPATSRVKVQLSLLQSHLTPHSFQSPLGDMKQGNKVKVNLLWEVSPKPTEIKSIEVASWLSVHDRCLSDCTRDSSSNPLSFSSFGESARGSLVDGV
jgi:hypothetical protein